MIRRKRMRPLNSACLGRPHHISPPHGPLRFLQDNRIRTRPGPRLATGHLASSLVSSPTSHLNLGVRCLSYPPPPPPNSTLRRGRGGGLPEVHSQGSHGPGSQAAGQKSAYRAVCVVPPYLSRQGFYSWYFLVPKKDGGLCPILDLRVLNKHLRKYNFRMLTHGSRLRSIKKNEWFTSIDLKDAFFHISIYSPHRKCLRFAYQGMCYEFTVLPFDLSLSPRTFCLCMEAGSNPLRIAGLKILTYIADWLIIADSREKGMQNTARVLAHITALGFRVNVRKSNFTPAQNVNFQGLELNSITMRRTQERILSSVKCLLQFREGARVQYRTCLRLQSLMAAAIHVLPLGLLRMRVFMKWVLSLMQSLPLSHSDALVHSSAAALEESRVLRAWDPLGGHHVAEGGNNRCFLDRMGSYPGGQNSEWCVAKHTPLSPYKLFGAPHCLKGSESFPAPLACSRSPQP